MYYEDPDGNSVELFVDNFGDWGESGTFVRTAPDFAALPMGKYVEPEKILAARAAGASQERSIAVLTLESSALISLSTHVF